MAHILAQANLQYYPTPDRVVELIKQELLAPAGYPISILDPSAGTGAALASLRQHYPAAWIYAVELSMARAAEVRSHGFTQAVEADALGETKYPRHAYDLLYFNPPYDRDREHGRLEKAFFKKIIIDDRALKPGGVFVGILSELGVRVLWPEMRDYFDDVTVLRFPDPEYRQFKQHVVLGRMRAIKRRLDDPSHREDSAQLYAVMDGHVPVLGMSIFTPWTVNRRDKEPNPLHTTAYQYHAGLEAVEKHGWHTRPDIMAIFVPEPRPPVQSLLPLEPSHVGVALAGGLFDEVAVVLDGHHVLIKGSTYKVNVYSRTRVRERGDGDIEISDTYAEVFKPKLTTVDLGDGLIVVYELADQKQDPNKQ